MTSLISGVATGAAYGGAPTMTSAVDGVMAGAAYGAVPAMNSIMGMAYGGNPYGSASRLPPYYNPGSMGPSPLAAALFSPQTYVPQSPSGSVDSFNSDLMRLLGLNYGADTQYRIAEGNDKGATQRTQMTLANNVELENLRSALARELQAMQGSTQRDVANIGAGASMYGSDQQRNASQYGSDRGYQGQVYRSDTDRYLGDLGANTQRYGYDVQQNIAGLNSQTELERQRLMNQAAMYAPTLQHQRFGQVMGMLGDPIQALLASLTKGLT